MKGKFIVSAMLIAMGVQMSVCAAEEISGNITETKTGNEYELKDNGEITSSANKLFDSTNNDQTITGGNIDSINSDSKIFYANTKTGSSIPGTVQTINIDHLDTLTAKNSVFEAHGKTSNDADYISKQFVNIDIDEIIVTGNSGGFYGGDGAIINNGAIQKVDGNIDKISISNPIASTGSTSYGNAAIYTVSASTGNPDLDASSQEINAVIGQIGDEVNRFGGGIISQQGAGQYIKYVGKIYAQQYGIATVLSDIGKQNIEYVGDVDVYSNNEKTTAIGIYNLCDTGNYDYVGVQNINVGNSIKADGAGTAAAIYNAAGKQNITSLNHNGVDIYGKTFSVYIKPYIYNDTHIVDTRTKMQGNFNIKEGDIKVLAPSILGGKDGSKNTSTLQFSQSTNYDNTTVLADDVDIIIDKGNNNNKDNTVLVLGDISNPNDLGYNIVMGKNSKIDDQGLFKGNGTITFNLQQLTDRYDVLGKGVLLAKVDQAGQNINTTLNVKVGDSENNSDKFASTDDAYSVLKDAANHIFVEKGTENIGVSGEFLANGKKNAGKVFIEEGLVHKYTADYFFDEAYNVGTNMNLNEHNYTYQGDILEVKDKETSTMGSIDSAAMLNYFAWREEVETISQRLGEVRDLPKLEGDWIRVFGSQSKYDKGNNYFENDYRSVAIGYDKKQKDSKWTLGGMFSYTDGESNLINGGEGDSWVATGAFYGTYLTKNGEYIDLIAKISRMHTGFTAISDSGDLVTNGNSSNWAYSVSAEYGHRYENEKGYFIDPQIQLTYGRINGADYDTDNGLIIEQENIDSLIGRAGIAVGRKLNNGSYFARFDAKKEFLGDFDTVFTKDGSSNIGHADMGDSWYELSIGGTCNFDEDTTGYFQVKRSFDADLETKYRIDIGLRYSFN